MPLIVDNAYGLPFPGIVYGDATLAWNEHTILCMSLSKLGLPGVRTGNRDRERGDSSPRSVPPTPSSASRPGSLGPAIATGLVESGEILSLSRDVIRPHYAHRAARAVDMLRTGLEGCDASASTGRRARSSSGCGCPVLPVTSAELYERLKARGVVVVSGHYFFPGLERRRLAAQARVHPHQLRRRLEPDRARSLYRRRGGAPRPRGRLSADG